MYPTIMSTSYELSSQFSLQPQQLMEQCAFCSGINIIRCMTISVANKHNEEPNFYLNIAQKLIDNIKSPLTIKFQEILKTSDDSERLTKFYEKKTPKVEIKEMLQYYKYRKFVPLFADLRLGKILHGYYYQRLKLYYNQIKRNLNLTIQPSQSSSFSNTSEISHSQTFPKSKILDELTINFKIQQTTGPTSIQNFKTQSKALEDLVNFLKTNQKFNQVRPFNVFSEWEKHKKTSKQIFRDIILEEKKNKDFRKNKSKIFITFYSRDGTIKKESDKKSTLKVLKRQKLLKSKDLKTLNKEKQYKILQKLERIKNQILDQKALQITKNDRQDKLKDKIDSGKKTPIKLIEVPKPSQRRKSLQKLTLNLGNQNLVNDESPTRTASKPKKIHSESKLKQPLTVQKNKSTKTITNKPLQSLLANQRLSIQQNKTKQLIMSNLSKKRPISRRKSLDLTKMKSLFPETFQSRIDQIQKKEDYLTQRYQNMALQASNKLMLRTTNVSPAKKQLNEDKNQIVLQKSDNIVSMKKKKLDMLKKKIELQKTQRK